MDLTSMEEPKQSSTPSSTDPSVNEAQRTTEEADIYDQPMSSLPSSNDSVSSTREVRDVVIHTMENLAVTNHQGTTPAASKDNTLIQFLRKSFGWHTNNAPALAATEVPLADAVRTAHTAAQTNVARRRLVKRIATLLFTINAVAGITALVMFWRLSQNE
mmetsp:Transcript_3637/g.7274  ORF Transcript_3637/g.7274 Transcript_3637/m.7274 type:complete len:160 (-) Transcript_3637:525-1004(-)